MNIDINRLLGRIEQINEIGSLGKKGVKRLALTKEDQAARNLLKKWMHDLNLDVKVDTIGNMFGIYSGEKRDNYVGIGSHLDTVPTGGYYDGTLGVIAALEVIECIQEHNIQLPFSLVAINFTNEEGARFQPDMMGSLAYANPDKLTKLLQAEDQDGISVRAALESIGYAGDMKLGKLSFAKFFELHIEQGPVLENEGVHIGIVEGVQSIHWERITLLGKNSHAGTTPMNMRRDPFRAFTALINYLNNVLVKYDVQLLTVGNLNISPNVINVIPDKLIATLDLRNPQYDTLKEYLSEINWFIENDKSFSGLEVERDVLVHIPTIFFEKSIINILEETSDKLGYSSKKMFSGAGHDAQLLSNLYPSAMIFIPSKNGISHSIDEYSSLEAIKRGANVLLNSIISLAQ